MKRIEFNTKQHMLIYILDHYILDYERKYKQCNTDGIFTLANKYYDRYAQLQWIRQLLIDDDCISTVYNNI